MGQDASPVVVQPGHWQMNRWQRRIERAEELAKVDDAHAELLNFYIGIARFQSAPPYRLKTLLELVRRTAPAPMRESARAALTPDDLERSDDPVHAFLARVLLQAEMEERAHTSTIAASVQPLCPFCGDKPGAAVLRPEGDGGKRFLLCSLCLTEWEFRRLLCPNCGEEDKDKLPVYTAEEYPHVRVEACDTCHVYLKAIDLTKNGLAVPEVDELASAALDIWAADHGYTKLQPNLFGL
jgi:FdhE protein